MKEGQKELMDVAKEIEILAKYNPCGMSDIVIGYIAKAIRSLMLTNSNGLSKEQVSKFLNISPRTLDRKISNGEIPRGKRWYHKELSWRSMDIIKYLKSNNKDKPMV